MAIKTIIEKKLLSNPKRASKLVTAFSDAYWQRLEEKIALRSFHKAVNNVPAYKDFLRKEGLKHPEKIQTIQDFKKYVPIITKENYINQYPLFQRYKQSDKLPFTLSTSGGTTGKPILQAHASQEFDPLSIQIYLEYLLDLSEKKVLYINAFALGSWYGGIVSTFLAHSIANNKRYKITISLCGLEPEIILDVIEAMGKEYDLIVISTYPSFFRLILQEAENRQFPIQNYPIIPLCSGELFTWRFKQLLAKKLSLNLLCELIDMYAATEAGIIGISTPLSILVQEKIINRKLSIASIKSECCSLLQHNPLFGYIEKANNELIITRVFDLVQIPLIRYRLKDTGGVIPFKEVYSKELETELRQRGFSKKSIRWPFIFIQGRADQAVILLGANIYPQQIKNILDKVGNNLFNNFKIGIETAEKPRFVIHLELMPNISLAEINIEQIRNKYHKILLKELLTDLDFKDAYQKAPEFLDPLIRIYPFGEGPFSQKIKTKPKHLI